MDSDLPAGSLHLGVAEYGSDARVVTVVGEVDTLTAPELGTCLNTHLTTAQLVVVDLDGVAFMGSAGLSALCRANDFARQEGRDLRLVCHSRITNRALEVTSLRERFAFFDNVPDALKKT